ncbi:MAG: hypothetical protein ACYTGH_22300 [Planctomycetota bacterium]
MTGPIPLGACRTEITVPCRDLALDQEDRVIASQWGEAYEEIFRQNYAIMQERNIQEIKTWITTWRIGEIGFAGIPGELFCEWGVKLKQESPFPWTYPVELCCDCVGYLVTKSAWEAGGYESLISTVAPVSVEGVEKMMGTALDSLTKLHA